ncbi:SET domain [Trypanosoma vivax]|uniref:SET domain-containing protein n=1 Tax=Trypanosoma vivax (strain Y486) TaxID=1055687 RepID=G0U791_TRYVY|nr:hypothetical protein TRVL_02411 [Trypanosoma vivax]KAH8620687.1 SET domain [Trypanosoma vivax]CCC51748.1 conserved hypothetical protein [Trypanosoma vivax Y486]
MSTPLWNYNESYYTALTEGASYCIKTDEVKGKGLFARVKIREGDIVHEETALCCSQNLDDAVNEVSACGNCLLSLESPSECVARVTNNATLARALPYDHLYTSCRKVKCLFEACGCTMVFCSVRCRETAWSRYHFAGCRGKMTEDQKKAYDELLRHDWLSRGVNYSDTVFLAFRFVCMFLTNIRMHHQPPEVAYCPVMQLVKAPLTDFRFTYLLSSSSDASGDAGGVGNQSKGEGKSGDRCVTTQHTDGHPVKDDDGEMTETFINEGLRLVDNILKFSEEERRFLTPSQWSELLGAILLNGQERSTRSNYDRLRNIVKGIPGGNSVIKAFDEEVSNARVDPQQLLFGSRGQGVYAVGSLFNHSCEPNLQVLNSATGDETLVVEALRDCEPGEELYISYIDESLPYAIRQQQLREHYLFECRCSKCVRESPGGGATNGA